MIPQMSWQVEHLVTLHFKTLELQKRSGSADTRHLTADPEKL